MNYPIPLSNLSKTKLKNVVLEYLEKNKLCALATSLNNKPWSATVFFAYDNRLHLLFFSREDTRHCLNINKNPIVSVAINQDYGTTGMVKGLQFVGRAKKVSSKDLKRYYKIFRTRYTWANEFPDHTLYRITPLEIHYIDQKLFGHFYRVQVV